MAGAEGERGPVEGAADREVMGADHAGLCGRL